MIDHRPLVSPDSSQESQILSDTKIPGIATLFELNSHLLAEQRKLSRTQLVIDGDCLFLTLYENICCINNPQSELSKHFRNDIYGGNLVLFAEEVRLFFNNLEKCNIKAKVLFSGKYIAESEDDGKNSDFITNYERRLSSKIKFYQKDDLQDRSSIDQDPDGLHENRKILAQSPTLWRLFRELICRNLKIEYRQLYYKEANFNLYINKDKLIILTESDEILSNVIKNGFILTSQLDYRNLVLTKDGSHQMPCRFFDCSKDSSILPTATNRRLALLKVILNPSDQQENLTANEFLIATNHDQPTGLQLSRNRGHHASLLLAKWASINSNWDPEQDFLLRFNAPQKEKIKSRLDDLMVDAQPLKSDKMRFALWLMSAFMPKECADHSSIIELLMNLIESCRFSRSFAQLLFNWQIADEPFLGDGEQTPFNLALAEPAIRLLIQILSSSKDLKLPTVIMIEFLLMGAQYHVYHNGAYESHQFIDSSPAVLGTSSRLAHLGSLKEKERIEILEQYFGFGKFAERGLVEIFEKIFKPKFVTEAKLCHLLLINIVKISPESFMIEFLQAIWLTLFYYAHKRNMLEVYEEVYHHEFETLMKSLESQTEMPDLCSEHEPSYFYYEILHQISQLQSSYKWFNEAYDLLNIELDHPDSLMHKQWYTQHELFFNSTLIFRLVNQFLGFKCVKSTRTYQSFEMLCKGVPFVGETFEAVRDIVLPRPKNLTQ